MISIQEHSAASKTIKIKTIRAHFLALIGTRRYQQQQIFGIYRIFPSKVFLMAEAGSSANH